MWPLCALGYTVLPITCMVRAQALSQDLLQASLEIPFSVPPYMSLLARAVATLEGIALTGDPGYQMVAQVPNQAVTPHAHLTCRVVLAALGTAPDTGRGRIYRRGLACMRAPRNECMHAAHDRTSSNPVAAGRMPEMVPLLACAGVPLRGAQGAAQQQQWRLAAAARHAVR